ncbi:MAG: hypothetical protein J5740_06300 [Bacteroidales bacterium]|nr:hypothetical protein [Bacteroidales bacterium]
MKRILLLLVATSLILPCSGKTTLGNKFAFAGLDSDQLVPAFAIEQSELKTDPRSESKPMKDEAFFYTGQDITKIPAAKVEAYLQQVYKAVKKAADGGKVYKAKGYAGDQLGEEITTPPTAEKPAATVMYLYQHDGVWFNISVGHKAYFRKFKKDYGEKWIGVGITVKEMLGTVE